MSRSRYKVTPFARFLMFMIIFAPIAYIGAAYYNGEDGLEKIKGFFNKSEKKEEVVDRKRFGINDDSDSSNDSQHLLKLKDLEIKTLKEKIERLEQLIEQQNKVIQSRDQ